METPAIQNNLQAIITSSKRTIIDVARSLGVSRQCVHSMTSGRRYPNIATAAVIAKELGCDIGDIYSIKCNPTVDTPGEQ